MATVHVGANADPHPSIILACSACILEALRAHSSRRMSTCRGRHSLIRERTTARVAPEALWACPRIHEHIDGGIAPMCRSGTGEFP